MASVAESDTSLWLHNKLGSTDDLWSAHTICSQLRQEILRNAHGCFQELQSHVKLKLLLSFMHLPRRYIEQWRSELEEILELAAGDSDQWVSVIGELLKTFPSTGNLNLEVEETSGLLFDITTELKKSVKRHSNKGMLPLECTMLNKNALAASVGDLPNTAKHFALKRKPKSAALRAELLQKSVEAQSTHKKTVPTGTIPVRSRVARKFDILTPLKGIPSRATVGGFRGVPPSLAGRNLSTPNRKEGGIKLLDITDQPIGFGRQAKRHKKIQDAAQHKDKEKEPPSESQTPDYAVGLVPPTTIAQKLDAEIAASPPAGSNLSYAPQPITAVTATSSVPGMALSQEAISARESFQQVVQQNADLSMGKNYVTTLGPTADSVRSIVQQHTAGFLRPPEPSPPQQLVPTPPPPEPRFVAVQLKQPPTATPRPSVQPVQQLPPTQQLHPQVQPAPPPQQKHGLSLTKNQMLEAQEMFKRSNKVTRPEKALILGFMAGSRDNPYPNTGPKLTIKLSENEETVQVAEGVSKVMMVETYFQMNYDTGQWTRIQQVKDIDDTVQT